MPLRINKTSQAIAVAFALQVICLQTAHSQPIQIVDQQFDTIVAAGKKVATQCFEFTAPVKSRIRGRGCRAFAYVQGEKASFDSPYASLEVLNDDPPGLKLSDMAKLLLETVAKADAKRRGLGEKASGNFDTFEGKFIGAVGAAINDMPAVFMRWGQENNPNINYTEIGCPAKDFRSKDPKLAPYTNVTIRMLATVPAGRFVWGGKPQRYFMAYGREKACDGPYFNGLMGTFKLL